MVNVVLTVSDHVKNEIGLFSWVNWSEVAREEVIRKEIFERYLKIDWHPVDELPLKDEFIKRLKETEKGRFLKVESLDEMFED